MPTRKASTKKASSKPKVTEAKAEARLTVVTEGVDTAKAGKLPSGAAKLPAGAVKLSTQGLTIDIQKLSKSLLRDQRARLVSSMGCVSNPGGPSC